MEKTALISIVVPAYNEEENIRPVYAALKKVMEKTGYSFELIFVDDGSTDHTICEMEKITTLDGHVNYLQFSRNFGKELATSAGIMNAMGDAVIMIDCDLQHPPEEIPRFLEKWRSGAEVVIGIRNKSKSEKFAKRAGSFCFYRIINFISETKTVPQATDFRLIDRVVVDEFNNFTEKNRMTRGLIDWLGFRREYVYFDAKKRQNGEAKYSFTKLLRLAAASFVSMSFLPLRVAGYLGAGIIIASGFLGTFIFVEKYVLHDPWGFKFSGPAILAVIILFLIGIVLACLGLIALYIGNIHREVTNRPMYVIRKRS